jgi:Zn finger protein HypA/HybF involved in hydrogenase expression
MSFDRWHPLDGNMIAADAHYEDEEEVSECPVCGSELEEEDDEFYCPECGWSSDD